MSSTERYLPHYTLKDYECWEGDWELLQGIPIAMTPTPFGPHQNLALRVAREILNAIEKVACDAVVLQETDWIVSDDTVVRPDVTVICGELPSRYIESVASLIVEVLSDSTRDRDLGPKRDLYLQSGVQHYLVFDPGENGCIYATNRNPKLVEVSSRILGLTICDSCTLSLDLERIFGGGFSKKRASN